MNEEHFNMEIRKFLKTFGVTSQRAIEQSVRDALKAGRLKGGETLKVRVNLEVESVGLTLPIDGALELEPKR